MRPVSINPEYRMYNSNSHMRRIYIDMILLDNYGKYFFEKECLYTQWDVAPHFYE